MNVVLFHHVQGLTPGVREFGERLRAAGHTVHTPDLFEGALPPTIEEGIATVDRIGQDVLGARADQVVAGLPAGLVYAGFSWGGATAQRLAQTRPGALGALLYETCVSLTADWSFGPWPDGVPVQVHGMDEDPFFAHEGDLDAARELVATIGPMLGELFLYPGDRHLFTDSSLPSCDPTATDLVVQRSIHFLDHIDKH